MLFEVKANVTVIIDARDTDEADIKVIEKLSQECLDIEVTSSAKPY
jgi:hypothetical protein